jgi:disulfide bond formation protein DsbB
MHDAGAVLALVALAGVVLMTVARLVPVSPAFHFLDILHRYQLALAALVASTATLGSLWFSETADWVPCRFCWFQRIFMYSAAVVLIVAAFRRDRSARWYAVPLAAIGSLLSIWHILLEHRVIEESTTCSSLTSCATPNYVSFGRLEFDANGQFVSSGFPITLAVMALSAFGAIIALLLAPEPLVDDTDTTTT